MNPIPDDPIIACIERTGYPPWMHEETENDPEEEENVGNSLDEDDDEFYYWNIRLTI